MNIASAATAFPKHYYPQNVLSAAFRRYWSDKLKDADLFERLQAHVGVDGRYLVLPPETYETIATFGGTNDVWIQAATPQRTCRKGHPLAFWRGPFSISPGSMPFSWSPSPASRAH